MIMLIFYFRDKMIKLIQYNRPRSWPEFALSGISQYLFLGGKKVVVVKENQIRQEEVKWKWYATMGKLAVLVLLFPLTLPLLALHQFLLSQYQFTEYKNTSNNTKLIDFNSNNKTENIYRQLNEIAENLNEMNTRLNNIVNIKLCKAAFDDEVEIVEKLLQQGADIKKAFAYNYEYYKTESERIKKILSNPRNVAQLKIEKHNLKELNEKYANSVMLLL